MRTALDDVYRRLIANYLRIAIRKITKGSVIVEHDIITEKTEAAAISVADTVASIADQTTTFSFDNTTIAATAVTLIRVGVPDLVLTPTTSKCIVFEVTTACSMGYVCQVINGSARCLQEEKADGLALIIGLGVGIPVGFLVVVILLIICIYARRIRRSNGKDKKSLDRTQDIEMFYQSGIAPKLNTLSRPNYYQPGVWQDPESDSDESDHRRRPRKEADLYQGRDHHAYDNGDTSNFSWDFMYQYVDPKQKYKIQRPSTEPLANLVYMKK